MFDSSSSDSSSDLTDYSFDELERYSTDSEDDSDTESTNIPIELRGGWTRLQPQQKHTPKSNNQSFNLLPEDNCPLTNQNSPMEFFQLFFTDQLINDITQFTNARATNFFAQNPQKPDSHIIKWKPVDSQLIKVFLGMWLHMGIMKARRYKLYWKKSPNIE